MQKVFAAQTLNLDTHYSLFGDKNIFYLLNGDVQGHESGNNGLFVQNQLSNSLCVNFPDDYILRGTIQLNNDESVLFFQTEDSSQIGVLDTLNCSYDIVVDDPCLNFTNQIRGVYKYTNDTNVRRIYFIDGVNPNRYLDLDNRTGSYVFPLIYEGSLCDSCDIDYGTTLDCDALRMNKLLDIPCITISQNSNGQLLSGVYQIGIAYGSNNLVLSDYYFSQPIKAFSEVSNIGFNVTISCEEKTLDQISVILVSQTRENSLVIYNIGFFPVSSTRLTINNVTNSLIIDTTSALLKRTLYEHSQFIATNGESLLLGKHDLIEPLFYQPQANNIDVEWQEVKVRKDQAVFIPSFLRDEVYAIGIEWFDKWGKSRGVFHIPGREAIPFDLEDAPEENDIYETDGCNPLMLKRWQVENTATGTTVSPAVTCEDCDGRNVSKSGTMSYWESENLVYPNDEDTWGELACQPIRHHKMPSHNLTHIHDNFSVETISGGDCIELEVEGQDGSTYTTTYCPPDTTEFVESQCVNILTIKLENIEHPKTNGVYDQDIVGYRILVADRNGNKSILHKGLIFNMWEDTSTLNTKILYPNYPFNDLNPDVFLSTVQTGENTLYTPQSPVWSPPSQYLKNKFTYHSPDFHFQEKAQEFGTELKVYGEEIGWIEGKFDPVYQHPNTRLGLGTVNNEGYRSQAKQVNSVAHYSSFASWTLPYLSRFKVEASQFLLPVNQLTSDNQKVNNFLRESSYYVSLNRNVIDPINKDVSRVTRKEANKDTYSYTDQINRDGLENIKAVSHYVGIKIKQPDQYGQLEGISYMPVTCVLPAEGDFEDEEIFYETRSVYGGDVFITKHSLLRKMPMWTQWLTNVPILTDIDYRQYRNAWYPRFWYDNLTSIDDSWSLDNDADLIANPGATLSSGYMYIFITGVVHYWCESEFIGDYRERDATINGSFYPKIGYDDIARSDRFPYDNKYLYNLSLLNNNIERVYQNLNPTLSDADYTVIFSQKDDFQSGGDKWLEFLPLNYTILPRIHGSFTGLHYTDMYSLFFIFEDCILYSRIDYTLNLNEGGTLRLGQGDIFTNRLVKLSNEQTGYVGSVDPQSFINTRYGTFFFDRKRKKFFKWTGQISDVTSDMSSWLQAFTRSTNTGYEGSMVAVFDNYTEKVYFTERSSELGRWTLSYNPKLEGFNSFHSFVPQFYITSSNTYLSYDLNLSSGVWKHNHKYDYQRYYGQQYAFDVGFVLNNEFKNVDLQSVKIFSEWLKYTSYLSYVQDRNVFFDKILVYNNQGNTGLMSVLLKDRNNPVQSLVQNSDTNNPLVCEVSQVEDSIYKFNKLESIVANQNLPTIQWNRHFYTVLNVDSALNPRSRQELKGKWFKLHLISDTNHEHKILVQLNLSTETPTFK